jgi:NADH-quinone oxidoreductase subunit N
MTSYFHLLLPELILSAVACVLILLGCSMRVAARRLAPWLSIAALAVVFLLQILLPQNVGTVTGDRALTDPSSTVRIYHFAEYIRLLVCGVGILLLLLAWPTNPEATGNSALNVGQETGEFFGLALLSLTGIMLVASANDIILLFLGIELASIPTYIMVPISRPNSVAQEAGLKYFFLGAMAAAIMLFGFSYLYGTTGSIKLDAISRALHPPPGSVSASVVEYSSSQVAMSPWVMLAVVVLIAGFAFKLAAVPMHVYVGDVYQGAATPLTAFLSFVPKTSGMAALIKLLYAAGGPAWALPPQIARLLWVLAVLTMTFGNVLGLLQYNIKRLLAYSSVAHSGYMLTGVATLAAAYHTVSSSAGRQNVQDASLQGVLFYLAAYGIMNTAAFGVLQMLPARDGRVGSSAETFEDIAGQGRRHVLLGLCMAVACFSLIGIPLTVGFLGKVLLIKPALAGHNNWLAVFIVINAAISTAYYLRIVGTLFLRDRAPDVTEPVGPVRRPTPIMAAIAVSVLGTLLLGTVLPLTQVFTTGAYAARQLEEDRSSAPVITPRAAEARISATSR